MKTYYVRKKKKRENLEVREKQKKKTLHAK